MNVLPHLKKEQINTPEDIKKALLKNKSDIKWSNWEIKRPNQETIYCGGYNEWYCEKTDDAIIIHGIGEKKVKIWGYWYTYEAIFKALNRSYKENSKTLNTLLCLICEDYEYIKYTEQDVLDVIKNRKNPQYLAKSEIPKYIPVSYVNKICKKLELPLLAKHYKL